MELFCAFALYGSSSVVVDMLLVAVRVMERVWVCEGPCTGLDGLYMRHGGSFLA